MGAHWDVNTILSVLHWALIVFAPTRRSSPGTRLTLAVLLHCWEKRTFAPTCATTQFDPTQTFTQRSYTLANKPNVSTIEQSRQGQQKPRERSPPVQDRRLLVGKPSFAQALNKSGVFGDEDRVTRPVFLRPSPDRVIRQQLVQLDDGCLGLISHPFPTIGRD